jgi:cohesin complex subunit SA-1/2
MVSAPTTHIQGKYTNNPIADIFTSGENMEEVTSQFLTNYAENNPAALVELVNMVTKCAGCSIKVTEDDVNDTENVEGKLGDLQEEFQAVGPLYAFEIESR